MIPKRSVLDHELFYRVFCSVLFRSFLHSPCNSIWDFPEIYCFVLIFSLSGAEVWDGGREWGSYLFSHLINSNSFRIFAQYLTLFNHDLEGEIHKWGIQAGITLPPTYIAFFKLPAINSSRASPQHSKTLEHMFNYWHSQ